MTVRSFWDNDQRTVMQYLCDHNWTWEEFFEAKNQANALMDQVSHKLGVIINSTSVRGIPPNMLAQARKGLRSKHPNTAIIVLVATNPFMRTMVNTLTAISPLSANTIYLAASLEEARALCAEHLLQLAQTT